MKNVIRLNAFIVLIILCEILSVKSGNIQFATCNSNEACVPFKECEAFNKIIEKGSRTRLSKEDSQYLKRIQCNSINQVGYVCCAKKVNFEDKLPKAPKCGNQLTDRIKGGDDTNIDEHPWTVQIQHKNENNSTESICGGALINERFVLTAAHCTKRNLVSVRLGDWDVTTNPDCDDDGMCNNPFVDIPIDKITVHRDYNPLNKKQSNDIALIKLQTNVTFSTFIKPICLPIDEDDRTLNMTDHSVEVAGFGLTENQTMSVRKKKLGMNVSLQKYCEEVYARENVAISSKQICAGGEEGKDSCNGDSGGALLKFINKGQFPHFSLVGLVSFGPAKCGTKDHPGVYTRVSEFMDWIVNNMD